MVPPPLLSDSPFIPRRRSDQDSGSLFHTVVRKPFSIRRELKLLLHSFVSLVTKEPFGLSVGTRPFSDYHPPWVLSPLVFREGNTQNVHLSRVFLPYIFFNFPYQRCVHFHETYQILYCLLLSFW